MRFTGVMLDRDSLGSDLALTPLLQLPIDWTLYPFTSADDTLARCLNADVVITNKVILDDDVIKQLPKLKHIAVAATGTNNVDKEAAGLAGISISNIKDYAGTSVAQLVFALLLELTTHANRYANLVKEGLWSKSKTFCLLDYPITELSGKTLGLIGYGSLAKSVEQLARAFGMRILVAEHKGAPIIRHGRVTFEQVLQESDVISLHCPLTEQTQNLIAAPELACMKSSAILINTARGGIVNESDLMQALNDGVIAAAAMDVLSQEPPAKDHLVLTQMPDNLIVTPHIAWASQEARQRLLAQLVENVRRHLLK